MEKNYSAETNNIIALCHILDDFEEFRKKIIPIISPKYDRDFVFQLCDISKGKFRLGAKKAKKFYSENKSVIDTINQYSNIPTFINSNYGFHEEYYGNLEFFYEYISSHKEEIDKILAVLGKLKELGFSRIQFNKDIDFTKEHYDAYPDFRGNFYITYVDNIEVIPNYTGYINYKTTSSNYKMILDVLNNKISEYSRKIVVNSLIFEPKRLPESINRENTYDKILKLKNEQEEKTEAIRNSVDLSISVSDLEYQLSSTNRIIGRLDRVQNKNELIQVLSSIKKDVEKLKTLSKKYDSSISEKEPSLTSEVLEREKTLYLKRREWSKMDID